MSRKNNFKSKIVIVMLTLLSTYSIFNLAKWNGNNVIVWDTISYYSYLPATFIYHDVSLKFTENDPAYYGNKFWPNTAPNGGKVIKTTMGLAVLYAPFFLLAHALALIFGFPADGFSLPYQILLAVSATVYVCIGLFWLRKLLLSYFDDPSVTITLLAVALCTNLLCYTTLESTMSHAYSFSLIAGYLLYTHIWHTRTSVKNSIIIGLFAGLIVLIRPINIIVFLYFFLLNVKSMRSLKEKLQFLFLNWSKVIIVFALAFLLFLPQLIYWKTICGTWLYNSYEGEQFYFANPHIVEGLFGFRKGWFIYTPLMFVAVGSIVLLRKQKDLNQFILPIVVFTIVSIYVLLSWWCWWYGGGFGLRAFIDFYAIWAIPLAALISGIKKSNLWLRAVFFCVFVTFVFLNIFQTYQYKKGIIHWDSMTFSEYKAVFCKLNFPANADQLIEAPDYEKARKGED